MMRSKFSTMSCATAFVTGHSAHDDDDDDDDDDDGDDEARILPPHTTCSGNNKLTRNPHFLHTHQHGGYYHHCFTTTC